MNSLPTGEPCLRFDELDSTNAEARRRARTGERGPLWILAGRQSAGRGRRGRAWVSGPGNLYATHLASPGRTHAERPQLALVAAVAVAEAIGGLLPPEATPRISCKWPNDILADGAKLAGILLDSEADWVATGIGVNLTAAPAGLGRPVTSLADAFGVTLSPDEALAAIAARHGAWRACWERQGFKPVRAAWLKHGPPPGAAITLRPDGAAPAFGGRFAGLDEAGALLLEDGAGRTRRFATGELLASEPEGTGTCC